jgi:DNA-binding response OmpR family regulator
MARQRILVVDDEEDIRELVSYGLRREGYEVVTAPDGESALARVKERRPDLVVLDLMLPGIDGLEVCRRLRADDGTKAIPVIMLTAKVEESDVVIGLGVGADDYVTKPFSMSVLLARLDVNADTSYQFQAVAGSGLRAGESEVGRPVHE